ncbi:THUMP domain-containing class I SAM-dependent RNA methyltransferase [Bdellovibrio bacteriovorus]|nr:RNA methyltransferase [Bdellovibrio bacteriovorus]
MNAFFVSTAMGFEKTALQEMKEIWPYLLGKDSQTHTLPFPEVVIVPGGLEFETDIFAGLQLNFFLKTAHRVLLRMANFKTRDLPKFYQKFKSLPWRDYLHHGNVEFEVAAQKSRVNNEKRLEDSAGSALKELFASVPAGTEPCATIYIRMEEDYCTISLDSTGEHLHKRGWSTLKGEAPLRETIASFMLKEFIGETTTPSELARVTLLDPMCGSGTLLSEARTLWTGQFSRPFAFQKWKKTPKLFQSESFSLNYRMPTTPLFGKLRGFDLNPEMLAVARTNFAEAESQIAKHTRESLVKADFAVKTQDALKNTEAFSGPLWMILNPPYGERLPQALTEGFKGLAKELCSLYKPQQIGFLYPEREPLSVIPAGYKKSKEIKINNGGLRCLFTVLTSV